MDVDKIHNLIYATVLKTRGIILIMTNIYTALYRYKAF